MTLSEIELEITDFFENNECEKAKKSIKKYIKELRVSHIEATSIYNVFVKYEDKLGLNELISVLGHVDFKKEFILNHLLKESVDQKKLEIIKFLVDIHRVDLFNYGKKNSTSIRDKENYLIAYASATSSPDILDYLVEKGMDINYNNGVCLKFAASNNNLDNIKHLINKFNLKVNEEADQFSPTNNALSWAVERDSADAIEFLLEHNPIIYEHIFLNVLSKKEETLIAFSKSLKKEDLKLLINMNDLQKNTEIKERNTTILNYINLKHNIKNNRNYAVDKLKI